MRRSQIFEDLYLKKNETEKKLYIFSDIEDKRKASNETYGLYKEFRKLGFDWIKELGHWVGDYSQFDVINQLIKSHNKIRKIVEDLEKIEDFIEDTDADPSAKSLILKKLDDYIRDLANATDQTAMDAAIRNYLTFYSKFHNYSLQNTWLIYLQKKDATKVASYTTWNAKNRGVKTGATVIWIWRPITNTGSGEKPETTKVDFTDLDTLMKSAAEKPRTSFVLSKVYDISDTYPKNEKGEVPETPKWEADNTPSEVADKLIVRLKKFAETLKIKITKSDSKKGEKGYSAGEHINLSSDISGVAEASVLVHELAHELLHWKTKSPFYIDDPSVQTAEMRELQAESVSYAVMKHYDLPVTQHPTYLALWKANNEKIMKNLQVITKCSAFIIDGVDSVSDEEEINEAIKLLVKTSLRKLL
jgi:hypothetical protein